MSLVTQVKCLKRTEGWWFVCSGGWREDKGPEKREGGLFRSNRCTEF